MSRSRVPHVTAVIQARMGSTRLPGKVLMDLGGRSVLSWVIRAARSSAVCDRIVVATTWYPDDDAVVAAATADGVDTHRGPDDDVLTRFRGAVNANADAVVRLTADCPLLDPALIAAVVASFRETGVDYVSTVAPRSLPRGLDVELVSADTLARLDELAHGVDRTHVTSFIAGHTDRFTSVGITVTPSAPHLRVTLDTSEDYELLAELVARIGDAPPSWQRLVHELIADPDLVAINANVRQKAVSEG